MSDQRQRAETFQRLHRGGELLLLPNIWDPLGALLLADLGFPAVATASAAIAYSNGYADGEQIPFSQVTRVLDAITTRVEVPVSADIESGYARNLDQLAENIRVLVGTGIAGINIEDTDAQSDELLPVEVQCRRIETIRRIADEMGVPLFINARTDVFIEGVFPGSPDDRLREALSRAASYQASGANGFYPILLGDANAIREIVSRVSLPVNILLFKGCPPMAELQQAGVARISTGPGFLRMAVKAMQHTARNFRNASMMQEIADNEVTSSYLQKLVSKGPR